MSDSEGSDDASTAAPSESKASGSVAPSEDGALSIQGSEKSGGSRRSRKSKGSRRSSKKSIRSASAPPSVADDGGAAGDEPADDPSPSAAPDPEPEQEQFSQTAPLPDINDGASSQGGGGARKKRVRVIPFEESNTLPKPHRPHAQHPPHNVTPDTPGPVYMVKTGFDKVSESYTRAGYSFGKSERMRPQKPRETSEFPNE
eukprot:NODE_1647_length_1343_cov_71.265842_g1364_i0.p2 GENE.NODE_1647_length_1343_cov_71.265842_g1364_i0~~NODE_1647_length_1343_cov_71.265842_g1364_i0.p2  ORF type:complete len:201 (-),score=33.00 NODE_1647_length_1343_cov_71.265842_g1364_i0:642-1244(-)